MKLKLEQGQVWKLGEYYFLIVAWARLTIEYKQMTDLVSREGSLHKVTKKEFCRLIKHAELIDPVTGLAGEGAGNGEGEGDGNEPPPKVIEV